MLPKSSARQRKQGVFIASIALASVLGTLLLGNLRFFQLVHLKASDLQFVVRGKLPTKNIVLLVADQKTQERFPELMLFWHPYYATAIQAAAEGGAKVMALDVTFPVPVDKWAPDNDRMLSEAVLNTADRMPVICSFVPAMMAKQRDWPVPLNLTSAMLGQAALANLTTDPDDFMRSQELLEQPGTGEAAGAPNRGLALRLGEKFRGVDATFENGKLQWAGSTIPISPSRTIFINFAGPPGTFPSISLSDFIEAAR